MFDFFKKKKGLFKKSLNPNLRMNYPKALEEEWVVMVKVLQKSLFKDLDLFFSLYEKATPLDRFKVLLEVTEIQKFFTSESWVDNFVEKIKDFPLDTTLLEESSLDCHKFFSLGQEAITLYILDQCNLELFLKNNKKVFKDVSLCHFLIYKNAIKILEKLSHDSHFKEWVLECYLESKSERESPLIVAVLERKVKIVEILLRGGVDPNVFVKQGGSQQNAFHLLIWDYKPGHPITPKVEKILDLLLEYGANPYLKNPGSSLESAYFFAKEQIPSWADKMVIMHKYHEDKKILKTLPDSHVISKLSKKRI